MDKKKASESGIRVEIVQGTDEAVAVDELIDDLLHGDIQGALHALHEPHGESKAGGPAVEPSV
ncbi:hypothetical protein [Leucobacter tenebrionis]|uniref:hypothetical protein n=1 Tax=Leucobacter tenebrionis TaxID=2873270 RepID=UPI001CA6717E|nr:hypothetical protein [Leucobacter tenebrionis]QZY51449.1 hypothetical protein KVY00_12860 [Leucobacter tenebrionis]